MRYRLRTLLIVAALVVVPSASYGDGSNDVMRLLLSNAELAILGEVEDVTGRSVSEDGIIVNICEIRVIDVLKGTLQSPARITVMVDLKEDHPLQPKKGDKFVFFIKRRRNPREMPDWMTDDV